VLTAKFPVLATGVKFRDDGFKPSDSVVIGPGIQIEEKDVTDKES